MAGGGVRTEVVIMRRLIHISSTYMILKQDEAQSVHSYYSYGFL